MNLETEDRSALVNLYWEKSENTLQELRVAIENEQWSMAANRLYYALFHAVTALLVKDSHPVNTHRGIKTALGEHYVLTGKLSGDDGRLFAQMATLRERADYDCVFKVSKEQVQVLVEQSDSFLAKIKLLLVG